MRLEKIILDDFLSYDHLEYDFERRPLLVQGINLTDERQKSNGTGKSAMQTAIEFCITASNSRDVRDLELVSYGKPEARAQLIASCDIRKETVHIDWTIKVKGSNQLSLTIIKDGKENPVTFSNVNDGKKWILNWFAISKEDLFNYYIINKSRFKSFFKSSNREKVDLINRFSDASIIEGLHEIDNTELENEKSGLEYEIASTDGKIELLQGKLEAEKNRDLEAELEEKLQEAKEDIEASNAQIEIYEDQIKNINSEIASIKEYIVEEETSKKKYKKEFEAKSKDTQLYKDAIDICQEKVDNISFDKFDFLETKLNNERKILLNNLNDKKLEREENIEKINKIKSLIHQIDVKLSGTIECPNCEYEFILDGDVESLKEKKKQAEVLQLKFEKVLVSIKESIETIDDELSLKEQALDDNEEAKDKFRKDNEKLWEGLDGAKDALRKHEENIALINRDIRICDGHIGKSKNEINEQKDEISNIKALIKDEELAIKELESEIRSSKELKLESNINTLQKEIKLLERSKTSQNKQLTKVNDAIYLRNQWKNNFKQFRGFLANQSLEVMEFHCNRYLNDMGTDIKVRFEGFKVLSNGTLKDEITAKVIRGSERSFSSFSGGEQGRILFASILANRHLINKTHPYGGLDFLSIDEIFEGVDSLGLKHLVRSAKNLNITAMIITHVSDEDASTDVLTIVKENGKSYIRK